MTRPPRTPPADSSPRAAAGALLRLLASLKLAVVLIVLFAVVLAVTTVIEAAKGRQWTQWYVYHRSWFIALVALLALNVVASVVARFPWRWRHVGFLVTHVGLLVLLTGAVLTFQQGIEGQLFFAEGDSADAVSLADHCQFTVAWQGPRGVHGLTSGEFLFQPGPFDWPEGKTLDIGRLGGTGIKVLKFYRSARVEEDWVADEEGLGTPALRFGLAGPNGQAVREEWLVADSVASRLMLGPTLFEFQRTAIPSMVEDFLRPPPADTDKDGVLSMHYEGQTERIPVSKNVGKKVPVGKTQAAVELVEYFPNAKPASSGRFISRGNDPGNPMLELRVHVPGKDQPMRQIAFARHPSLNLDGVHGRDCPVKFWYHHPAAASKSGVEFLQTPDGQVHCRVAREGKLEPRGAVSKGSQIEVSSDFKLSILEYLPKARRKVTFSPTGRAPGESAAQEPAALVEVSAGETTQEVWLKRNDPEFGSQEIRTSQGPLTVSFVEERLPLGYSLKLLKFTRGLNPGRMGDASFSSSVRLIDKAGGLNEEREISMNRPLEHGKFTFYQSSFQELSDGRHASVLTVSYDPGRFLKYLGSLMICGGAFIVFYLRRRSSGPEGETGAGRAQAG